MRVQRAISKSDAKQLLVTAVETLAVHKPFFTGKVFEALLDSYLGKQQEVRSGLTGRGTERRSAYRGGKSKKSIADVLTLRLKTVETHRASAMRKLKLDSTAALVRYAVRNKLVEP